MAFGDTDLGAWDVLQTRRQGVDGSAFKKSWGNLLHVIFIVFLNLNSKIILKPFGNFKPVNSWDILECSIANSSPPSLICFVFF